MNTAEKTRTYANLPVELRMLLFNFCEVASQQFLHFEPDLQRELLSLAGKTIRLEVTDLNPQLTILLSSDGLRLFDAYLGEPDTHISLDSVNAFRLFTQRGRTPVNIQMNIRGDIHTGQKLKQIIDDYHFDWNEKLSYVSGDLMAQQISKGVEHLGGYLRNTVNSLLQSGADYVVEEKQMVAHYVSLLEFTHAVTKLRNDLDRAEARLQRLQRLP